MSWLFKQEVELAEVFELKLLRFRFALHPRPRLLPEKLRQAESPDPAALDSSQFLGRTKIPITDQDFSACRPPGKAALQNSCPPPMRLPCRRTNSPRCNAILC